MQAIAQNKNTTHVFWLLVQDSSSQASWLFTLSKILDIFYIVKILSG